MDFAVIRVEKEAIEKKKKERQREELLLGSRQGDEYFESQFSEGRGR